MRVVEILRLSFHFTRDDVLRRGGIARIAMDEDTSTFGRADGETTDAIFFMQELQLSLLLSPFGAALFLGAGVWLWK